MTLHSSNFMISIFPPGYLLIIRLTKIPPTITAGAKIKTVAGNAHRGFIAGNFITKLTSVPSKIINPADAIKRCKTICINMSVLPFM